MKTFFDVLVKAGTSPKDWGYLPYILALLGSCGWPLCWIYCNENKISFA